MRRMSHSMVASSSSFFFLLTYKSFNFTIPFSKYPLP